MKELGKNIARPFYHFIIKLYKTIFRYGINLFWKEEKINAIPIIINNRNRLTYLLKLIARLESMGLTRIFIIDNGSTYPPLLEYYKHTRYTVYQLVDNVGYMALWKTNIYNQFKYGYYVYTDPDVVPVEECPNDFLHHLFNLLKKHPEIEKIGLGLKYDDLPESYHLKDKVIEWEQQFWENKIDVDLFNAPTDTTFALYRPLAKGNSEECPAYRTGGIYMARHLPWYENTALPNEETDYYSKSIKNGTTFWTGK